MHREICETKIGLFANEFPMKSFERILSVSKESLSHRSRRQSIKRQMQNEREICVLCVLWSEMRLFGPKHQPAAQASHHPCRTKFHFFCNSNKADDVVFEQIMKLKKKKKKLLKSDE